MMAWYSRERSSFNSSISFSREISFWAAAGCLDWGIGFSYEVKKGAARLQSGSDDTLSRSSGLRCFFLALLFGLQGFHEFVRFLLGDFPGSAVVLLNLTDEDMASAFDYIQVVIGQLSPLLFDLSFVLLPLSFHLIPVHGFPPW